MTPAIAMGEDGAQEFHNFIRVHELLLAATGLPRHLQVRLFDKLVAETFDAGSSFRIEPINGNRQRRCVMVAPQMRAESDVFLVDHAWSFRLSEARKQLQEVPGLAQRMGIMMGVAEVGTELEEEAYVGDDEDGDGEEDTGTSARKSVESALAEAEREAENRGTEVLWLELDDLGIDDAKLCSLHLSQRYPSLFGLSLWGNKIGTVDAVVEAVAGLCQLKALWLNNNPVEKESGADLAEGLRTWLPELEMYNTRFTRAYTNWAVGFCADVYGAQHPVQDIAEFALRDVHELDLSNRWIQRLDPKIFNPEELPLVQALNITGNPLKEQSRDELLGIVARLPALRYLQVDVPSTLGWSLEDIADELPELLEINNDSVEMIRKKSMNAENGSIVDLQPRLPEWSPEEPLVDRVLRAMWQYVLEYRLATDEKLDETPIWYVMDEFGSSVRHSDTPNFKCVPFMYMPDGTLSSAISYSLIWPLVDVQRGDECFRDYLSGIGEDKHRSSRLTAWFHTPRSFFRRAFEEREGHLTSIAISTPLTTAADARVGEDDCRTRSLRPSQDLPPLKVYIDNPQVLEGLNRAEFEFVEKAAEADIIWTTSQLDKETRKILELRDEQFINQFPYEACIVMKHHLAQTMTKAYGRKLWLQQTYELDSDLPAMIGDFQQREETGEDNLWILKPWNMARSIDSIVTRNFCAIIRAMETGPKICQKYIERPALFGGRKFDLRYILLLRSISPLEVFVGDMFWSRFSNNPYSTSESSLSDYETHFTVMNYGGRKLNHLDTNEFISGFEKEHGVLWSDIDMRVKKMLREVFEAAAAVHPEMHNRYSRALYGVDVMLDDNMQPKLLEVTYCPDCMRACKFDMKSLKDGAVLKASEFFNTVFGCLFLDERANVSQL